MVLHWTVQIGSVLHDSHVLDVLKPVARTTDNALARSGPGHFNQKHTGATDRTLFPTRGGLAITMVWTGGTPEGEAKHDSSLAPGCDKNQSGCVRVQTTNNPPVLERCGMGTCYLFLLALD
ncbi:hypothetical protein ZHAS_00013391 [Anopheles sinensis]|uniref:Uncharacterized protein n=1 Tax=Anopheles sinensis TaxID=74873 RepID=A0A084W5G0_ANOSI|nr:hypothetical protein ZHAS_00013391 [Anopheles sinensis]